MEAQTTRCVSCGLPAGSGRFCSSCGAEIPTVTPAPPASPPAAPPEPAYESMTSRWTSEQPSGPQRGAGTGLWVGAAAGLVAVLLLGTFLLLSGGGSGDPSASSSTPAPTADPQASRSASTEASSPAGSSPSAPRSTASPATPPTEVAGAAVASAPSNAPGGVDLAGRPVTYVAANMVDGAPETCWRTPGDAHGTVLSFRLEQPTRITQVGLINGYAKTAFAGGRRYDWYQGDRRVLAVDWIFDDGTTVSQLFHDTRAMQSRKLPPVTTSTVQVRITAVSPPGQGPAARDDTAVSEVSLVGSPG
jgi:hypothetical protein